MINFLTATFLNNEGLMWSTLLMEFQGRLWGLRVRTFKAIFWILSIAEVKFTTAKRDETINIICSINSKLCPRKAMGSPGDRGVFEFDYQWSL